MMANSSNIPLVEWNIQYRYSAVVIFKFLQALIQLLDMYNTIVSSIAS